MSSIRSASGAATYAAAPPTATTMAGDRLDRPVQEVLRDIGWREVSAAAVRGAAFNEFDVLNHAGRRGFGNAAGAIVPAVSSPRAGTPRGAVPRATAEQPDRHGRIEVTG